MNKIKFITLGLMMMVFASFQNPAFAGGVGFINYKKVQDNCTFAKKALKQVDAKSLELQQYLVDKEKEFKSLDTPIKKKNFKDKTAKSFSAKEEAFLKFKLKKEEEVYNKIQEAAQQVLVEQKLDAIVDFRIIFVGGMDITDLVVNKLNSKK
jgi:Skp family chaperone for outer membrane proteins